MTKLILCMLITIGFSSAAFAQLSSPGGTVTPPNTSGTATTTTTDNPKDDQPASISTTDENGSTSTSPSEPQSTEPELIYCMVEKGAFCARETTNCQSTGSNAEIFVVNWQDQSVSHCTDKSLTQCVDATMTSNSYDAQNGALILGFYAGDKNAPTIMSVGERDNMGMVSQITAPEKPGAHPRTLVRYAECDRR